MNTRQEIDGFPAMWLDPWTPETLRCMCEAVDEYTHRFTPY